MCKTSRASQDTLTSGIQRRGKGRVRVRVGGQGCPGQTFQPALLDIPPSVTPLHSLVHPSLLSAPSAKVAMSLGLFPPPLSSRTENPRASSPRRLLLLLLSVPGPGASAHIPNDPTPSVFGSWGSGRPATNLIIPSITAPLGCQ